MAITPALEPVESVARSRLLRGLFFLTMLLAWHAAAKAQTAGSGLRIQAALGFAETVRLGNWAPLTITLENTGALVEGKLEVDVASGDQLSGTIYTTTSQRDLQITAGARKRYQFTVFINNFSIPVQIRVVSAGEVIAQQSIDLRQRFTDSRLLLVLSRNADLDYLNESSARQLRVAYPHPDLLPNQWQGYDGVAAVVVHGVTLEQWTEQQYQALRKWLGQGGTLVVSGGPDYASLRTPRLAELLPVMPGGLAVVEDDEEFRKLLGQTFSAHRPFQIHQVRATDQQITLTVGKKPLLLEKQFGAGRVVYMTFDIAAYPFNGWAGMPQFWLTQLAVTGENIMTAMPAIKDSAMPALFKSSAFRFPDRLIVFSFLLAYFGVVAVVYRYNHVGAGKNQWITWIAPMAFVPVTWLLFVMFLSPAAIQAAAVSVITPLRDGPFARLELDIGLYSNRAGLSSLELEHSGAVFLPGIDSARQDRAANWLYRSVPQTRVQALDKYPFVLHTLHGTDVVDYSLQVTADKTESGLQVSVHNMSHQTLSFGWLVFNGWLYPLGAIQSNSTADITVSSDDVVSVHDRKAFAEHLDGMPEHRFAATQSVFAHTVTRLRNSTPLQKNEALFVALPQNVPPVLTASTRLRTTEVSLLMTRLSVAPQLQEQTGPRAGNPDAR